MAGAIRKRGVSTADGVLIRGVAEPVSAGVERVGKRPDAHFRSCSDTVRILPGTSALFRSGVLGRVWGWQKVRAK